MDNTLAQHPNDSNCRVVLGIRIQHLLLYLKKSILQKSLPSLEKHLSVRLQLHSQHCTHLACHALSSTLSRNRSRMGRSQPAQWTIMSPACRTPSGDLPWRAELIGLRQPGSAWNNVLAPGNAGPGETKNLESSRCSRHVPYDEFWYSPAPAWLLSRHLSQSPTNPAEMEREEISATLEKSGHGFFLAPFFEHQQPRRHISALVIPHSRFVLAPVIFFGLASRRQSRSITASGVSRGFACATRVPVPRLDAAPVNSRCARANQSTVVMVTRS